MLFEFLIDLAALTGALRPKYRLRPGRLILASALGGLFSCSVALFNASTGAMALCALIFMPIMILIVCGRITHRELSGASCSLAISSALITAAIHILPFHKVIAAGAALCCAMLLTKRQRWLNSWDVRILLSTSHGVCELTGIIDTGNRLTEPISSLPVMVAGVNNISSLLPDDFNSHANYPSLPVGFRLVPFGGLGGNGYLECFMPDSILIEIGCRTKLLRNIWVAIYPDSIPGGHGALLPASVITDL